ncbi:MAG: FtsB family cell division protein [Acidobacteriota bacterium]
MRTSKKGKRELTLFLILVGCVSLFYTLVLGDAGYKRLVEYQNELRQLQLENLRLREKQRSYLQKINKLKNDPAEIERIARERYNFARPGDIIVELP